MKLSKLCLIDEGKVSLLSLGRCLEREEQGGRAGASGLDHVLSPVRVPPATGVTSFNNLPEQNQKPTHPKSSGDSGQDSGENRFTTGLSVCVK